MEGGSPAIEWNSMNGIQELIYDSLSACQLIAKFIIRVRKKI